MRDVVLCRKVDGQIQSMQEFLVCKFYFGFHVFFCISCILFSAISRGGVKMKNEILRLCERVPPGKNLPVGFELSHSGGAVDANNFAST